MIQYLLVALLLLCAAAGHGQTDVPPDPQQSWELTEAKWADITDVEGRFRVSSPGAFVHRADTLETPLGMVAYHTFFLAPQQENAENEVYMVSYMDHPEGTFHPDSTELVAAVLEETQLAAEEAVLGELRFARTGTQQNHPYRYWRIDYLNGRASVRTKAFVAGQRFYSVQTVTRQAYGMNHSMDRFIDSFRIF